MIVKFDESIFVGNHSVCLGADRSSETFAEIAVSIVPGSGRRFEYWNDRYARRIFGRRQACEFGKRWKNVNGLDHGMRAFSRISNSRVADYKRRAKRFFKEGVFTPD